MNIRSLQAVRWCLLSPVALLICGCATRQTFTSSDQAVDTLVAALRTDNHQQIQKILGPHAYDVLSSGDPVSDHNNLQAFLTAYGEKHQLVPERDGVMTLLVGNDDWPMPVPIVKKPQTDAWYFDLDAGRDELVNRRIGRNELDTIQVCLAIVDAQRDYFKMNPEHQPAPVYAQKFLSDPGQENGLYWPTSNDQAPSPLGPLVASAAKEGYHASRDNTGQHPAFHGYRYAMLTSQGTWAPGGAKDYKSNGKMTSGFAVVAYPAQYGDSGVMTFIINQEGILYSRDLGPNTSAIASSMASFDPDPQWKPVEDAKTVIVSP